MVVVLEIVRWYYKWIIIYKYFIEFDDLKYFKTNELGLKINSKIIFIDYFFYEIFNEKQNQEFFSSKKKLGKIKKIFFCNLYTHTHTHIYIYKFYFQYFFIG